jgi:adenylate cyclase
METSDVRRPLAVVFCDIAGTSGLMAREGDLVVSALLRAFFENAGRLSQEHHCLSIKFVGDGFVAAFENIGEVLPFAIEVQKLAETHPSMRGRELSFRFSLHCGEVLCIETSYGKDVFGDDVNLVARLNDIAEPGEMVVSHTALEQMPPDQKAAAGATESQQIKSDVVEFHRVSLT